MHASKGTCSMFQREFVSVLYLNLVFFPTTRTLDESRTQEREDLKDAWVGGNLKLSKGWDAEAVSMKPEDGVWGCPPHSCLSPLLWSLPNPSLFLAVLGTDHRAECLLGKYSTLQQMVSSSFFVFLTTDLCLCCIPQPRPCWTLVQLCPPMPTLCCQFHLQIWAFSSSPWAISSINSTPNFICENLT